VDNIKVNLTKDEIGVIIKCIDTAIMSYINHQWDTRPNERRRSEGILLNKLKEKFCKAIIREEENKIKEIRLWK